MRATDELRRSHPLTDRELRLLDRLLPAGHSCRDALLGQARRGTSRWLDSMGQPAILFEVPDDVQLAPKSGVVSEAEAIDRDRQPLHVLLHVRDGKLAEIEIYREDGRGVVDFPDSAKMQVL